MNKLRWKYLFLFYIKQIAKSKLYIGASVLFFLLLISRLILFFSNPYDMEQYGQLPSEVAMIVQMVSIFYMIFFYRIHSNELLYGIQSFFVDGYRIMLEKICAMFVAHFMYQGMMLVVTYTIYTGIYFSVGIEPSSFYLSLLRFLVIYMFTPLMLSMLYGLVVAMIFGTKKSSFIVILLMWIVTGSMSTELFFDFFHTVHAGEWQSLLFIGMNTVQHVYNSYIGFDVHWGNELKLITWFLILTGMILILSLRWTRRKRERSLVIKVLLGVLCLSMVTTYGVVELSTKAFSRADDSTETDYYINVNEAEADLRYEIESYSISLEGKKATVQVKFSEMNTLEPSFQLYHAYPVKSIQAGSEKINFERDGDILTVHLPMNQPSLTFHYEIVDSSFIPHTNNRIVLLADKAWYPKKRDSHMYEINKDIGEIELSERFSPEESYFFTVKTEEVLFSNLPRHGEVYSGEAQAVTLIKGQGNRLTYGDYQIAYPADWPEMKKRVPKVLSQLEKTVHEVQQLAPTTIQSLPTSIVFSNYGLSSLVTKDHLVYNTNYGDAVDSYETTKDFQENMLKLAVQRKGSYKLYREWTNLSSQFIRQKKDWKIESKERSVESFSLPKEEQESIEFIYHHFYQLNHAQQQQFLREWYQKMDEKWTWDQVLDLVKERR
ncbi:ABC transporter permease [Bacillus sp. REN10]|uniref:ABC transporter permease n=1 Tax=Bacillus sp. REN10 TaxID=2782541 RepID=UPI0031B620D5